MAGAFHIRSLPLLECTHYLAERERIAVSKWRRAIGFEWLVVDACRVGAVQIGQHRAIACELDDRVVARDGIGIGHASKIDIRAAAFFILARAPYGNGAAGKAELFVVTEAEISPRSIGWRWLGRGIAHAYSAFLCINGRWFDMHRRAAFRAKGCVGLELRAARSAGLLLLRE